MNCDLCTMDFFLSITAPIVLDGIHFFSFHSKAKKLPSLSIANATGLSAAVLIIYSQLIYMYTRKDTLFENELFTENALFLPSRDATANLFNAMCYNLLLKGESYFTLLLP